VQELFYSLCTNLIYSKDLFFRYIVTTDKI